MLYYIQQRKYLLVQTFFISILLYLGKKFYELRKTVEQNTKSILLAKEIMASQRTFFKAKDKYKNNRIDDM